MLILILEVVIYSFVINITLCTVGGISYMETLFKRQYTPIEDPCNPPYWYPRQIPEYCLEKSTKKPKLVMPLPVPIPIPHPVPQPLSYPIPNSFPFNYPLSNLQPNIPIPIAKPLPIVNPLSIMSSPGVPYQPPFSSYQQIGMVPGLPGIVSPDGGINILPFSDAYSDLLEKHKRRTLRRRMQKILREYNRFSHSK